MTAPQIIFAAIVFLVGIPAAFHNRTAGALVAAYLAVQAIWLWTGAELPALLLFWIDLACVAAICTRRPVRACYQEGALDLAACLLWKERTWCDRVVLACFPAVWWFYVFDGAPWWPLYWLSLAQLIVASGEGLRTYSTRRGPSAAPIEDERPPGGVEFAWAGRKAGGG